MKEWIDDKTWICIKYALLFQAVLFLYKDFNANKKGGKGGEKVKEVGGGEGGKGGRWGETGRLDNGPIGHDIQLNIFKICVRN